MSKLITGPLAAIIALRGNFVLNSDEVLQVKKEALNKKNLSPSNRSLI